MCVPISWPVVMANRVADLVSYLYVGFGGSVSLVARFARMSDTGETDTLSQNGLRPVAQRQDLMPERSRRSGPRALDRGTYPEASAKSLVASRREPGCGHDLDHGNGYCDRGLS